MTVTKIVWDWNGTLLDDVNVCLSCLNDTLDFADLPHLSGLDRYREIFGFPIQDYYVRAGFDFSKIPWPVLANHYMDDYMSRWRQCSLFPDVLEALDSVKEQNGDNIILSASRLDYLKEQVGSFPLENRIDALYGIGDIYAHSKLELAEGFKATCLEGDEIWCIGDTLHDAEIAGKIGAHCILICRGHQSRQRLETAGVPVVSDCKEAVRRIYERSAH